MLQKYLLSLLCLLAVSLPVFSESYYNEWYGIRMDYSSEWIKNTDQALEDFQLLSLRHESYEALINVSTHLFQESHHR